jgi:hypothetical protein
MVLLYLKANIILLLAESNLKMHYAHEPCIPRAWTRVSQVALRVWLCPGGNKTGRVTALPRTQQQTATNEAGFNTRPLRQCHVLTQEQASEEMQGCHRCLMASEAYNQYSEAVEALNVALAHLQKSLTIPSTLMHG